jgi:hypothetical protein
MKNVLALFAALFYFHVGVAGDINSQLFQAVQQASLSDEASAYGLKLKVGDFVKYNMSMAMIKGSMTMTVKEVSADVAVIEQALDLGFLGKQNCLVTLNPNTGETKSIVCNGQEQQPGSPGDIELVEQKEDTIKVPAGTFTCLYIKAIQKASNQTIEQWVNLKEVPVFGSVKSIIPAQLGKVTLELAAFKRN